MVVPTSGFNLNPNIAREVQQLAFMAGTTDTNTVMTYALRFLKMLIDYQRLKEAPLLRQEMSQQRYWSGALGPILWPELEEELANALRLWLTLQANMPINRIILDRPRSAGGTRSLEVAGLAKSR